MTLNGDIDEISIGLEKMTCNDVENEDKCVEVEQVDEVDELNELVQDFSKLNCDAEEEKRVRKEARRKECEEKHKIKKEQKEEEKIKKREARRKECEEKKMKEVGKRKNADFQWSEFVIFIILYYHSNIDNYNLRHKSNIHFIQDISILLKIYNNEKEDICKLNKHCEKFIEDLKKQNKEVVEKYIMNFYSKFEFCKKDSIFKKLETIDKKIQNVYLTGKSILLLKDANSYLYNILSELPERDRKGDIFVKLNNDEYCGISVKKDTKCQFTNWSIDTIMSKVTDEIDKNVLKKIRKDVLDDICSRDIRMKLSTKEKRKLTNTLMYESDDRMDEYKKLLDEFISKKYNDLFINTIIDGVSQNNKLPYKLFTYDGEKAVHNSEIRKSLELENNNISIIRDYIGFNKKDYNNIKTHYSETAAKMWYFIKVNDEIKYRFEIRSKGNWDNSPQLLIHNI